MTKPKPKPLGSTIEVPEGARVVRPGGHEADARTIAGGVYVFDAPGVHTIDGVAHEVDGVAHEVDDAAEVEAKA